MEGTDEIVKQMVPPTSKILFFLFKQNPLDIIFIIFLVSSSMGNKNIFRKNMRSPT